MAATFNLVRNSRVFFTTDVSASTGKIPTSGTSMTTSNTFELTVLDGFSFSQNTQSTTISINEAGNTPSRGSRSFNTALDPVEFSFSTYIRPSGSATVTMEESVLWNALFSASAIDTTGVQLTGVTNMSRATTATNYVTLQCTAVNLSGVISASGDVATVGGFNSPSTLTNYQEWSGAAVVTVLAGSLTAATSIGLAYLTAPLAAAGTSPATAPTGLKLFAGAYATHASSVSSPAFAQIHAGGSNRNQLQKFGVYFLVDNALYAVDNCVLDQASIDFGLDGIATVQWTGKGTALRYLPNATVSSAASAVFGGTGIATGTAAAKSSGTTANYITNKLSTVKLISSIGGVSSPTTYNVALTGGNITISNNATYVVPANLGVVNEAITYFTGARAISGNITAYLRTGTNNTAELLNGVIASGSETKYKMQVEIGGASNAVHVDLIMNGCTLQVPTIDAGDVMSTTINFLAQPYDPLIGNNTYDLAQANDIKINYYSA